jgi:hypothetical protein
MGETISEREKPNRKGRKQYIKVKSTNRKYEKRNNK